MQSLTRTGSLWLSSQYKCGNQYSLWLILALFFCNLSIDLHLGIHVGEMSCADVRAPVEM